MKMQNLINTVSRSLVEREDEVAAIVRGIVAREHVMFVGPPGTGKSYMCRVVSKAIDGCRYCERLLAPTTPPEALFGPISLSALKEDRYEYAGKDCVTDSEIVFLDEFFRGSDAIRDTLLHLLGPERQALIGSKQVKVPLMCAIGAANTWADGASQAAIMDRWTIRRTVRPVTIGGMQHLLFANLPEPSPVVTLGDVVKAQAMVESIQIPESTREGLLQIIRELGAAGIKPSDRRCRAAVKVAKAEAVIQGANEVHLEHLECLSDVLWDDPNEHPEKCREIISKIANPHSAKAAAILAEATQIIAEVSDAASRIAAIQKLQDSEAALQKIPSDKARKVLEYVRNERIRMQAMALGIKREVAEALLSKM